MDVTVVGSCNMDLISYVERLPKPGETIQGSKFSMGFGGKGANQCVMAGRLGAKTTMIAKVGKDTFGETTIQNFKDNGISTEYVSRTDDSTTGTAPICVDSQGQNSIVIILGANLLLSESDLADAEHVISGSKVMICQLEIDPKITLAALKMAKKHGVKTILNPAPAIKLDKEFLINSDIFCPNETEAEILTGHVVESVDDARVAAAMLLGLGCGNVIVTLGSRGCLVAQGGGRESVHVPAPKVDVLDSTGAGDSFIGALAFYISTHPHLDLLECTQRAVQIASTSVQKPGTQTSYPKRSELPSNLFD